MNFLNFINHPLVGTPYGFALDLCIVLAMGCWVLSILTREYSIGRTDCGRLSRRFTA